MLIYENFLGRPAKTVYTHVSERGMYRPFGKWVWIKLLSAMWF